MVRTISIDDTDLRTLFDTADATDQPVAVEDDGKLLGVVLNAEAWERYREFIRERAWEAVDEIRALNAHEDPDEVLAFVTEIVEEVRQELYDARRAEGHSGS